MSVVRFKFKADPDFLEHALPDGAESISVADLKRAIADAKFNGNTGAFGLKLSNVGTSEEYVSDDARVPADANVLVKRVPLSSASSSTTMSLGGAGFSLSGGGFGGGKGKGGAENGPVGGPLRQPPPGYVCRRCNQPGHFIAACPTNGDPKYDKPARAVRPVGIPRSMLKKVETPAAGGGADGEERLGGMVNADGEAVTMVADDAQFMRATEKKKADLDAAAVPEELRCPLTKTLFRNAVLLPCCGASVSDDAISQALLEEFGGAGATCVLCGTRGVRIDEVLPNQQLRSAVKAFLDDAKNGGGGGGGGGRGGVGGGRGGGYGGPAMGQQQQMQQMQWQQQQQQQMAMMRQQQQQQAMMQQQRQMAMQQQQMMLMRQQQMQMQMQGGWGNGMGGGGMGHMQGGMSACGNGNGHMMGGCCGGNNGAGMAQMGGGGNHMMGQQQQQGMSGVKRPRDNAGGADEDEDAW